MIKYYILKIKTYQIYIKRKVMSCTFIKAAWHNFFYFIYKFLLFIRPTPSSLKKWRRGEYIWKLLGQKEEEISITHIN